MTRVPRGKIQLLHIPDPLVRKMVPVSEDMLLLLHAQIETSVASELKRNSRHGGASHPNKISEVLVFVEGIDEVVLRDIPLSRQPYDTVVREAPTAAFSASSSSSASNAVNGSITVASPRENGDRVDHESSMEFVSLADGFFKRKQTSISLADSADEKTSEDRRRASVRFASQGTTVTRKYCNIINLKLSRKLIGRLKKKKLSQVSLRYDLMVPAPIEHKATKTHDTGSANTSTNAVNKASSKKRTSPKESPIGIGADYICIASVEIPHFLLVKSKLYRRIAKKQDIQTSVSPYAEMLLKERQILDQSEAAQIEMELMKRKFQGRINRIVSSTKEREDQLQQLADGFKAELEQERSKVTEMEEMIGTLKKTVESLEMRLKSQNDAKGVNDEEMEEVDPEKEIESTETTVEEEKDQVNPDKEEANESSTSPRDEATNIVDQAAEEQEGGDDEVMEKEEEEAAAVVTDVEAAEELEVEPSTHEAQNAIGEPHHQSPDTPPAVDMAKEQQDKITAQEQQIQELRELVAQLKVEREETLALLEELKKGGGVTPDDEILQEEETEEDNTEGNTGIDRDEREFEIRRQKRKSLSRLQRIVHERKKLFESMSFISADSVNLADDTRSHG